MANNISFQAQGKTYKCNAAATSQSFAVYADAPCNQVCVSNHQPTGNVGFPVYLTFSSNASITVSAPTNGAPAYAFVSVPGTIKTFTIPQQFTNTSPMYVAFVTDTGATSECYVTPGEGL